jgi:peptidoglycan/LPS O-acetylase OafA/YrhL
MGGLRLFLAVSVVYGHLGKFLGFPLLPGDTAVQCFYLISGFYMSLVLNGKYENSTYWTFMSNRLLRLYPLYLVVLISSAWLTPKPFPDISGTDAAFFIASQLTLFGRDIIMFLHISEGAFRFTPNFYATAYPLYAPSLVPQAWTLGVELWFYLIAPFILRCSIALLVVLFLASVAVRLGIQAIFGWHLDPWSYRFFPSEAGIFILGSIAHRLMNRPERNTVLPILAAVLTIALYINHSTGPNRTEALIFFFVSAVSLPWLFNATKKNAIDSWIGELSYPLYIVHNLFKAFFGETPALAFTLATVASVALAVLIDRPVDRWRQRRISQGKSEAIPSALQPS